MAATLLNTPTNREALTILYRAGARLILSDGDEVGELAVLNATDLADAPITIVADLDLAYEVVERYAAWPLATAEALQEVYDALEQATPAAEEHQLYLAWVAADNAWQAALERTFGTRAGDMRYAEPGRTGPDLEPLHRAFMAAQQTWLDRKRQS